MILAAVLCLSANYQHEFKIKENKNSLEIDSPWGFRTFASNLTLPATRHYKFEIPIETLKPVAQEDIDADAAAAAKTENKIEIVQKEEEKKEEQRKPQSLEFDYSDRLVVEANHLYNKRKYFEASQVVEELIRMRPKYTRAWVMKGSLMYKQGHKDLAKKAWEQALTLEPENKEVQGLLERYK